MSARATFVGLLALAALACSRAPASQGPAATPSPDEIRRAGNHLVGQPSPYLKQHSHNPVDWYPWAEEVKARAKRENKPIFLSIGYSTCHWCHVMEKESFEDDEVARTLNDGFLAIKVDREERPDVDAFFMSAASELGSSTGWPLTLVLTPDLEPFFAATYLPKEKLKGALGAIRASWAAGGADVKERAKGALARMRADETEPAASALGPAELAAAIAKLARGRDDEEGGFGARMKFPNTPLLLAELRFATRTGDPKALAHVDRTLERMAAGGVHDHLAGTFHRYATDRHWHVPHFEKTLYDNAQLASLYLEASRVLGRPDHEDVARAILDDLIAGWQQKDGGLIVGFDADDAGGEGAFYTWTPKELKDLLGAPDAELVGSKLGVTPGGETSLGGRSVLHRLLETSANRADAEALARSLPKLVTARLARPRPPVDDKELTAWNGLALMAFADAARALNEPRYRAAAERIGAFLLDSCWNPRTLKLSHGKVGAVALGPGFLDDYALAALGLARLHAATGEARWLLGAESLLEAMVKGFAIPGRRGFSRTDASVREPALAGAPKDEEDGPLPSGGSAAALALLELGALAGDRATWERGEGALRARAHVLVDSPYSSGYALVAADALVFGMREVVIAGGPEDEATRALLGAARAFEFDRFVLARVDAAGASKELSKAFPALEGKTALGGKPTAFVCTMGACDAPTSDLEALRAKLSKR